MPSSRTKAVLEVLRNGRDERLAAKVLRIFGASSIAEALATYEIVGAAERATLDEAIERMTGDASAAFLLGVDGKLS